MAYVSFGLDRNGPSYPEDVTIGTDDGGAGNNVTLSMDKTASMTRQDVIEITKAFIRRLEDGAYNDLLADV